MASLTEQRRSKRKRLAKIAGLSRARTSSISANMLQREVSMFLNSHAVQSVTLYTIWNKRLGAKEAMQRWKQRQLAPIVCSKVDRLPPEPISWRPKERSTSGFRKICSLPSTLKMWHVLANDLVRAQHRPRPHIGDWPGRERGRDRQVRDIANSIVAHDQWVVIADIRRAFQTVNVDALYELPYLPQTLIRRAIDYRSLTFVGGIGGKPAWDVPSSLHDYLEMAPVGILEGSPASNALFSVLLDDLPDHLNDTIKVFVYCDNIVLLAPSKMQAQQAATALDRYFAVHPAGPFEVTSECRPVWAGFDHLGYFVRHQLNGETVVDLGTRNWSKLNKRLCNPDQSAKGLKKWLRASFGELHPHRRWVWDRIIDDSNFQRARQLC